MKIKSILNSAKTIILAIVFSPIQTILKRLILLIGHCDKEAEAMDNGIWNPD